MRSKWTAVGLEFGYTLACRLRSTAVPRVSARVPITFRQDQAVPDDSPNGERNRPTPAALCGALWPKGPFPVPEPTADEAAAQWLGGIVTAIVAARHARGWSQATLAKQAKVRAHTLGRIEKGETWPDLPTLTALLSKLNLELPAGATRTGREPDAQQPDASTSTAETRLARAGARSLRQTALTDSTGSYAVLILASGPHPDLAALHTTVSETGIWPRPQVEQLLLDTKGEPATNMQWLSCGTDTLLQIWARTDLTFGTSTENTESGDVSFDHLHYGDVILDRDDDLTLDMADLTIALTNAWPNLTFRIIVSGATSPESPFQLQTASALGQRSVGLDDAMPLLVIVGGDAQEERLSPRGVLMPVPGQFRYRYTEGRELTWESAQAALVEVLLSLSRRDVLAMTTDGRGVPEEAPLTDLGRGFRKGTHDILTLEAQLVRPFDP